MRNFIKRNEALIKATHSSGTYVLAALPAFLLTLALLFIPVKASAADKNDEKKVENSTEEKLKEVRSVFSNIETGALELLPKSTRLDMLDYWDADSIYKASNVMGGLSWLENVTDNYLKVHITNVSSLEIKILPLKKGKIIATVYTVGSTPQAADSQVEFYDENLKKADLSKYFRAPEFKDFFEIPKGSTTSMKELREMVPFPTVAYSLSPDSEMMRARMTVEDYIDPDDWNIVKLFLKPEVTAEWKKDKFSF